MTDDDDTPIRSEGELIETYLAPLAAGDAFGIGLGDDCAFIAPRPGTLIVLKTDALAEGVHFLPYDAPEDIAWKALAVNVSDLAAKAAVPRAYLMALSFPHPPTHGFMRRFARGLADAQAAFGLRLAGGDTDRRPGPMTITPAVLGEGPATPRLTRREGRPGDLLYVSGTLGDAAMGLALRRDAEPGRRAGLGDVDARALVQRYLRPVPRLALRQPLLDHGRAAMDLSDGLVKDLGRLCRASGVGAAVEAARLPLSRAARLLIEAEPDRLQAALSGGDDYEILVTIPPGRAAAFESGAAAAGVPVTRIGHLTEAAEVVVQGPDGRPIDAGAGGWDHFGANRDRIPG